MHGVEVGIDREAFPVPGHFKLVDHALSRPARKGAIAVVTADGPEDPEIFDPEG